MLPVPAALPPFLPSSTQCCPSTPQVAPLQAVPSAVQQVTLQQLQQPMLSTQQTQQLQQLGMLGQQQLGATIVAPGQMAQAAQLQQQYAWAAK